MHKKERANEVIHFLNLLYPEPAIPLDHKDEFTLLISVLLSAQCTDKKVNEITPFLYKIADSPQKMQRLGSKGILDIIKPIGLSKKKAVYIEQLSDIIVKDFSGKVPKTYKELESLPGVGHKTASVVMSQAFGYPAFPVDTHIHRLSQRWELTSGKNVLQTERDLKNIFPKKDWNRLHIQIIYYGREFCSAKGCDGTICPLCKKLFPNRKNPVICKKA